MAQAPAVGPLPAVALPRANRFSLSSGLEVVCLRRDVAPIVSAAFMFRSGGACDPPGRTGLASIAAEMLDEGAGAARRAGHRGGAGAAGRRSVAGERARRLAAVDAGAARDVPRGDGDGRRHPDPAPAGDDRLAARSQRPADGRRAAPRSARGGRQRGLRPHAVRRRPPVRAAGRRARADARRDHARRRARFSRGPLPAEPRVAGGRGRLRRGDAAGGAGDDAGRLEAGAGAAGAAPDAVAQPAAPGAGRSPGRAPERRADGRARHRSLLARSARAVDAERDPGRQLHEPAQLQPAREARLHLRRRLELLVPAPRRHLRRARRGLRRVDGAGGARDAERAARPARTPDHRRRNTPRRTRRC